MADAFISNGSDVNSIKIKSMPHCYKEINSLQAQMLIQVVETPIYWGGKVLRPEPVSPFTMIGLNGKRSTPLLWDLRGATGGRESWSVVKPEPIMHIVAIGNLIVALQHGLTLEGVRSLPLVQRLQLHHICRSMTLRVTMKIKPMLGVLCMHTCMYNIEEI